MIVRIALEGNEDTRWLAVLQGVEKADVIFNVVFFVVVISIMVQGTAIGHFARWLNFFLFIVFA